MLIHGAIMLLAGIGFGYAVTKAGVLPRWTGLALMAGVVLVSVSQGPPESAQVLAAAVRDLGFAGMGAAVLLAGGLPQAAGGVNPSRSCPPGWATSPPCSPGA